MSPYLKVYPLKKNKLGNIYVKTDPSLDFYAIIALHDNPSGPAIGGCRCIEYASHEEATYDALRLAQMMHYKAKLANLKHGGAKAVLMKPKHIKNRQAYFEMFGNFVDELKGRYITAVDSGTSPNDMDIINKTTQYVVCTTAQEKIGGGASAYTALGVRRSIQAAVKFRLGRDDLAGVHVAIQGAGSVGYYLAKELSALGADLTICDTNPERLERCRKEFAIQVTDPSSIYSVECDVFAPCALGSVLNASTIPLIKAPIIVGAANNQLADPIDGLLLQNQGILYAPDFVANAGGLMYAAAMYNGDPENKIRKNTEGIYNTVMDIFTKAKQQQLAASEIATQLAEAISPSPLAGKVPKADGG